MTVQHDANQQSSLARISTRVVQHKDYYGLGPEWAKAYFQDDLVVVLMRGGFTKVEETLLQAGRGASVIQQRRASRSGSDPHPDLHGEIFILEPQTRRVPRQRPGRRRPTWRLGAAGGGPKTGPR
jgi:hypothetical protein